MTKKNRNSLIISGLMSSAGFFLTKALSILYVSPLQTIIGEANNYFYSSGYSFYATFLSIFLSGIPFAIATMVAKYYVKEDYKSILLIKKIGNSVLFVFGFVSFLTVFIFAQQLVSFFATKELSVEDTQKLIIVYRIIAIALFTVPLLSSERGFIQGLKEFKLYSFSQIIEQIIRILFMLGAGAFVVYILDKDQIWGVYLAIFSISVSACITLFHLKISNREKMKALYLKSHEQTIPTQRNKDLLMELFYFSIPYLVGAILGDSRNLFDVTLFQKVMDLRNENPELIKLLYGLITTNTNKLTSIPQVLATGFSVAIIPLITMSYEEKDFKTMKNHILKAIHTVAYIALPVCICLASLSTEIYYVMYGAESNYLLGGEVLQWASLIGFFGTISPICTSLMFATRLRRKSLFSLSVRFVIKLATMVPFIYFFGYSGAITSSAIVSVFIITINMDFLRKEYDIPFQKSLILFIKMLIGGLGMTISFHILKEIGFQVIISNRFLVLIILVIYGLLGTIIYILITTFFKIASKYF